MATSIITDEVSVPGKTITLKAYVARPSIQDRLPAVIVVQEWWGLNEHIRDICRRFAAEGYYSIAPDLYSRQGHKVATDPDLAARLMAGLKKEDGIADLISTVAWLKGSKLVRTDRIGVIGFCMGGSSAKRGDQAIREARRGEDLSWLLARILQRHQKRCLPAGGSRRRVAASAQAFWGEPARRRAQRFGLERRGCVGGGRGLV